MKKPIIILTVLLLVGAIVGFKQTIISRQPGKKFLPLCLDLPDSTRYKKDLQIWFRVAFKKHHIQLIGNEELLNLIDLEVKNTLAPYFQQGGSADFNKIKVYLAANQQTVANNIILNLLLDDMGNIAMPVRWRNSPQPIKMDGSPRPAYRTIQPDSVSLSSIQQLTQCIADSIVASGELVKEN